jgi:hypothetical protein
MAEPQRLAVVLSDDDLSALCRAQAAALRVTYGTLDRYSGFTEGFWSKKLQTDTSSTGKRTSKRGWSSESFQASPAAFCFKLIAVHDPEAEAKLRAWMEQRLEQPAGASSLLIAGTKEAVVFRFSRKYMRKLSRSAARARKNIPRWKRKQMARKANRARNEKLSANRRREIAKAATEARWERVRAETCQALGDAPIAIAKPTKSSGKMAICSK